MSRRPAKAQHVRRRRPEDALQAQVVKYLRYTLPPHWAVHHSPNEEASEVVRKIQAGKGVLPGFADVIILGEKDVGKLTPLWVPYSWLIELKDKGRTQSEEQISFEDKCKRLGYPYGLATSLEEVRQLVIKWELPTRDVEIIFSTHKWAEAERA